MICLFRNKCPEIKFSETLNKSFESINGLPVTVFITTLYNKDEYDVVINTTLPVVKISFYEYLIIPSSIGNFNISITVSSKDGIFVCTSPSLVVDVLVKALRTADDNVFTMDSKIITADGFKP